MPTPSASWYPAGRETAYPSDIDDAAWELIAPILAQPRGRGRRRMHPDRVIDNAILYVVKGGIPWRMLPATFPPWPTVSGRFRMWADAGIWAKLTDSLRETLRIELGREPGPSAGILDSQSVPTGPNGGAVGYDAGKKVKGRKRHLLVDTEGLLVSIVATPANVQDPAAARAVLTDAKERARRLAHVWTDGRYVGPLIDAVSQDLGITIEVVARPKGQKGFRVLPKRWIVERSLAWYERFRRLAHDWEAASWSVVALIRVAASNLMARRLARYWSA